MDKKGSNSIISSYTPKHIIYVQIRMKGFYTILEAILIRKYVFIFIVQQYCFGFSQGFLE